VSSIKLLDMAELLEQQLEVYRRLLELGRRKQRVLMDGNVDELDAVVSAEALLIERASELESMRLSMQEKVAAALGLRGGDVTLAQLVEASEGSEAERLYRTGMAVRDVLHELGRVNELNAQLLKQSLAFVRYSLRVMGLEGGGYDRRGQPTSPVVSYVDQRA